MRSKGFISSLLFCEIKTHQTRLLAGAPYRVPDVYQVSKDIVGAVAQVRKTAYKAQQLVSGQLHRHENGLRRVRLYDARASCLTYLANNGVPDHLLAMWAGHTNVKTTKKWYVKPDVADLLPAAEAWGGLAGGV
jgi:integrase